MNEKQQLLLMKKFYKYGIVNNDLEIIKEMCSDFSLMNKNFIVLTELVNDQALCNAYNENLKAIVFSFVASTRENIDAQKQILLWERCNDMILQVNKKIGEEEAVLGLAEYYIIEMGKRNYKINKRSAYNFIVRYPIMLIAEIYDEIKSSDDEVAVKIKNSITKSKKIEIVRKREK